MSDGRTPMRAKYIGDEDAPNSKSTILFGARRKIGEAFDVPEAFEAKARYNKFIEVISEPREPSGGGSTNKQRPAAS